MCVCVWPIGVVWSPDEGVATLAGRSDHAAEEEGDWGQTAVGQQARQAAAGQRGDHRGTTTVTVHGTPFAVSLRKKNNYKLDNKCYFS